MIFRSEGVSPGAASEQTRDVLGRRAMAGLAVDARFRPDRVIGVGLQVVVDGKLAHVAGVTGGVEGEFAFRPVQRRIIILLREMAHAAHGGVEPDFLLHVVGDRQRLQSTSLPGRQEVIDVLAPQYVGDGQFLVRRRVRAPEPNLPLGRPAPSRTLCRS